MKRDLREYARQTNIRLLAGALFLLFIVGLGLIWIIYGSGAVSFAFFCLLAGLAPLVLILLIFLAIEWISRMPDLSDSELIRFKDWTLRIRPASVRPARLLLLVHGWTGDENSMWVFARDLPPENWIVAPRAPHLAEPRGYSWRRHDSAAHGRPSLELLRPSVDALLRLVDEYSASVEMDAAQFDVIGFSQGAAMAGLLAMLHPGRVRRVGVLAGFVPSGAEALVQMRPLEGMKIFVAHGTLDEMVPVDRARASIGLLEQAGAEVAYCEEEVGHKVGAGCLRALRSYLAE